MIRMSDLVISDENRLVIRRQVVCDYLPARRGPTPPPVRDLLLSWEASWITITSSASSNRKRAGMEERAGLPSLNLLLITRGTSIIGLDEAASAHLPGGSARGSGRSREMPGPELGKGEGGSSDVVSAFYLRARGQAGLASLFGRTGCPPCHLHSSGRWLLPPKSDDRRNLLADSDR